MTTRDDLTQAIYKSTSDNVSRIQAKELVNIVLETIVESLVDGKEVKLSGFGVFYTTYSPKRLGRNPKTGEVVEIPAHMTVRFRSSSVLKDRINGN